jgi:hypothetical protein
LDESIQRIFTDIPQKGLTMPNLITVRRNFVVPALLEIEDQDFAHWYSLGMYWAMFGDSQAQGRYQDTYLIHTIGMGINHGWYADKAAGWFPMIGLKLGMVHGGWLTEPAGTLMVLTDPDFTKGYWVGRDYHFTEAILEGRIFSDRLFCEAVHEWALGYSEWHDAPGVLRFCLGCRIGELSAAVIPAAEPVILLPLA